MLPNKKIIAFDLDGTLTESKQKLKYEMAELLLKLMEKATVVVISGGAFTQFDKQFLSSLREVSHLLKIEEASDPEKARKAALLPPSTSGLISPDAIKQLDNLILLPTDGSQRYDYDKSTATWKLTHLVHFPTDLKERVFHIFDEIRQSAEYDIPSEAFGPVLEDRQTQVTFSALGQNAPLDKKKAWDPDQAKRKKIKAYLDTALPEADISIGGATSLDILPKGFNKAVGLDSLLSVLNMTKEDMAFVGDAIFPGGNDYSVFENGIQSIKVSGPTETMKCIREWLA